MERQDTLQPSRGGPDTIAMWLRIFIDAYAQATKRDPHLSEADDKALRARLGRLIIEAYAEGIRPKLLVGTVLKRLSRQKQSAEMMG